MLLFVSSSLQRLGARPVHACTRCARAARRVNPLSHSLAAASRSLPTSLSSCPRYRMVPIHPARIEGYDASHTAGEAAVVSRVVFNEGAPSRAEYRTTAVRPAVRNTASSQPGNDDYIRQPARCTCATLSLPKYAATRPVTHRRGQGAALSRPRGACCRNRCVVRRRPYRGARQEEGGALRRGR